MDLVDFTFGVFFALLIVGCGLSIRNCEGPKKYGDEVYVTQKLRYKSRNHTDRTCKEERLPDGRRKEVCTTEVKRTYMVERFMCAEYCKWEDVRRGITKKELDEYLKLKD